MSNHNNQPPPQNPIPQADYNTDPSHGRVGPIRTLPGFPRPNGELPNLARTHAGLTLGRLRDSMKANEDVDTTGNTSNAENNGGEGSSTATEKDGNKVTGGSSKQNKGEDEEDEDDEDEEDDEEDDFYEIEDASESDEGELIEKPIMTPPESPKGVYEVTDTLAHKLPPELVPDILEFAEYYARHIIAKRDDTLDARNNASKVYLKAKIPDFKAFDENTAGKGGNAGLGGRRGRVRRLIFRVQSRDQGWSGDSHLWKGTYIGCWSWLEVELWRKADPASVPTEGEGIEQITDAEGMMRVGEPHLLQKSKHATADYTSHEIVWDWKEDDLPDDHAEKWETDREGQRSEGSPKNGRIRNGKFVRELRGGDEIRVVMRCQFPGWSCSVRQCEVECIWAA